MNKADVIKKLKLEPLLDEGGYFKRTHKSTDKFPVSVDRYSDEQRSASTAIYYLLGRDNFSALHKLKSEEHWSFLGGVSLNLRLIHPDGRYEEILIGSLEEDGTTQLFTVPADVWFCASINAKSGDDFTLVSCVVSPGFEFADFELGNRDDLLHSFPQHASLIEKYTRSESKDQKKYN